MRARTVVRRGARLGVLIGAWPAGIAGVLCLVAAFVFLVGDLDGTAYALAFVGGCAVLGSMAAGVTVGAATGLALAFAPRRLLANAPLRGLLAALIAALLTAALTVAALTAGCDILASTPPSDQLLVWSPTLVIALLAAARSGEIAGYGTDR
ncbi:hypothetical protein ACFWBB_18580 [Streptomyces sp. NPDC060000]|uniref:hypothetical protein n=1 Tax=Streptomyces sp. NPDC060000 TaxID=3347031 RepID=UPI003690B9BD